MKSVHELIRVAENNYVNGDTTLGKYVNWSMHDTIERIDAYLNSKHTSGETDSLGREKPFFNITTAAVNVWYRATDIDRKDIKFVPQTPSSNILAFVANVVLQNWMDKERFGVFLNQWGRGLSRYGSSITKFIEQGGRLIPSVIPWNRFIPDAVDFESIPRIEKFYKTPAQLRKMRQYDQDIVDELITAVQARKTLDGQQQDNQNDFIEIFEVHGELDTRLLDEDPDLNIPEKDVKYRQQMHVVSFVKTDSKGEFDDYTLFSGLEAKDPYGKDDLIEEDGRTLAIGAPEYLFDAQWMQNHSVKNMKDTLDIASKLIFQTADTRYVGRNVLSAIETGDIFTHQPNMPLTRVANDKPDIQAMQNFGTMWQNLGQEITSTPEALRGTTLPSGTPYSLGAYLGGQAGSLFEIMTENKGLAIENMLRTHIIPHIKKKLKNTDDLVAILDAAGIKEIDAMYVPNQAIKQFNERTTGQILKGETPEPFNQEVEENAVKEALTPLGNKRFFKPDEMGKKTWEQLLSDFEWDNIKVEVTNENNDKQANLQTLASLYTTTVQRDPVKANIILARIMSETGVFSPIEFAESNNAPVAPQATPELELPTKQL